MEDYSIANTTKEQRIALIKSWQPEDEMFDENDLDIWEIYRDYINGTKEIAECNAAVAGRMNYTTEDEMPEATPQSMVSSVDDFADLIL